MVFDSICYLLLLLLLCSTTNYTNQERKIIFIIKIKYKLPIKKRKHLRKNINKRNRINRIKKRMSISRKTSSCSSSSHLASCKVHLDESIKEEKAQLRIFSILAIDLISISALQHESDFFFSSLPFQVVFIEIYSIY